MTREHKPISRSQKVLSFRNGTKLDVSPFTGAATQWTNDTGSFRAFRLPADEDTSLAFQEAMAELGIYEQETIHLDVTGPGQLRAYDADPGNDQIVLRPAQIPAQAATARVVLYQDESGGISWHFPDHFFETASSEANSSSGGPALRATPEPVFTIPTRTVAAQEVVAGVREPSHLRGPITKWGRKIFKVLVLPIAAELLAKPLELIVGKIERKHRRDLVRSLSVENYRTPITTPFSDWAALDGKRALLIIHGIFSSTDGMLAGLPRAAMATLEKSYEGRMIAFDQLTVSKSPQENARFFLEQVTRAAPAGQLEFDVLCHSRGGIVARTMVEQGQTLVPNHPCKFRKVYFVASPNQGSVLADPAHVVDMLDVFTNLLTNFPDGPILYSVEIFLAIIKLLAYTAERTLPGLAAMGTEGYISQILNRSKAPSRAAYASSAANYDPDPSRDNSFFTGRFANYIIDRIFTKAGERVLNDLIVPRDGVHGANGHPSFPIEDALVYEDEAHVWHTGFFGQQRTISHILKHFEIEEPAVLREDDSLAAERVEEVGDVATVADASSSEEDFGTEERRSADLDFLLDDELAESYRSSSRESSYRHLIDSLISFRDSVRVSAPASEGRGSAAEASPAGGEMTSGVPGTAARDEGEETTSETGPVEAVPAVPIDLQRIPQILFHEQVIEGETNDLTVRLEELASAQRADLDNVLDIAFGAGETSVEVTVLLSATGFDLVGTFFQKMIVQRQRNPELERVVFQLTARNPGPLPKLREITAGFWLHNSCIGSVTHRTYVVPKGYKGSAPADGSSTSAGFAVRRERREDCDLIIDVQGQDESGQPPFRISLRSELPANAYSGKYVGNLNVPGNDLALFLDQYYQRSISQIPSAKNLSESQFQTALKKWEKGFNNALDQLGKELWTYLPPKFREEYFKIYLSGDVARSIIVHSDEMIFPWELVVPNETINGKLIVLEPLGISHVLGRWKEGLQIKPVPQKLSVRKFCVLNPKYAAPNELQWSLTEITALKTLFPNVSVVQPADRNTVDTEVLSRSDIQVFHFSGHGQYDPSNSNLSELMLEGTDTLDVLGFSGTKLCAEANPIVYLNACSVGSTGLSVGRMGGFAANFLKNGCSGVIAPYWPINDKRAAKFSVSLYKKLQMGRAIGEALQELRIENREDPTVRAYSYFGDPWARMNFSQL